MKKGQMGCEECFLYYSSAGKETPCAVCPKPLLDPSNELVWELFNKHIVSQVRAGGMGGFIGFDYTAIEVLLRTYSVPTDEWFIWLDKISVLTKIAHSHWKPDTDI